MEQQTCTKCKLPKDLEQFHSNSTTRTGRHGTCKSCRRIFTPEQKRRAKEKRAEYEKANPLRGQTWFMQKHYGLTLEDYNKMLESQNSRCAICNRHQSEFNKRFAIDHCHVTNKVRGLLCSNCNVALGIFQDSPYILKQALSYLLK